ncbi:MAG TPA: hypothetical protein VED01_25830 [Burkholderiales bacterium]|nr:hypothetical protein [Burkholderiales bacterium]
MSSRRCTATLTLVLIGTAALQGCGRDEQTATRDVYKSRQDCLRDWGGDPQKCEQQTSGPHAGYFLGPLMYGAGRSGFSSGGAMPPRKGSSAIGSTTVSRGGFGSSASAHRSSGG